MTYGAQKLAINIPNSNELRPLPIRPSNSVPDVRFWDSTYRKWSVLRQCA